MKPEELETGEPLNDDTVSKYLIENPEFFNRKGDLLLALTIPHESGTAISLLERQVSLFRERNRELQENINEFIFNAEENDALFEKTRIVILELLKTNSLTLLSDTVDNTLKAEFAAHASRLFFITEAGITMDTEGVRTLDITAVRETLGKLFDKKRTFCCELTPEQAKLLFPDTKKEILSAAVIPVHLTESLREEKGLGMPMLVIGSERHNHFNSSLDTLFLDFIGEILVAHITRMVG
jgi:uncharacterized protein YigA (DUF484 family)